MLTKEQEDFLEMHFRKHYRSMCSYAWKMLIHKSFNEEAVQETFKIACEEIDSFYSSSNPERWLFSALRNVVRNIDRVQGTLDKYIVQAPDFDEIATTTDLLPDDYEHIFGDIAKSDDFKLLKRIVLDKYTMLEASQEFNITVEACKKRVQRIKKKLKDNY